MVRTPVGFRCPDCARGPRPIAYQVNSSSLALAGLAGLAVALVIGVIWGLWPEWSFHVSLLLGFGVVETMARVSNYRRGRELMVLAMVCITVGIVLSRLVIAYDAPYLTASMLWNNADDPLVRELFRLDPIPDYLFAALPFGIAYIRFR